MARTVGEIPHWQRWVISLGLGAVALLFNSLTADLLYLPVGELKLQLLPGLAVGLLLFILFGLPHAVLGLMLAALPTLWLWNTWLALPILLAELLLVAWLVERRGVDLPLAVLLFWAALGLPLWWMLVHVDPRLDMITGAVVLFKQALAAVVLAAMVGLMVLLLVRTRESIRTALMPRVYALRAVLLNILVLVSLLPPVLFFTLHLQLSPVMAIAQVPAAEMMHYLAGATVLLVVCLLLSFVLSDLIINRPLKQTTEAALRIGEQFFMPRIPSRMLEPDSLNVALVSMAEHLRAERTQLERQTRRLERIVYRSPIAIWCGQLRPDCSIQTTFTNGAVEQITGLKAIPSSEAFFDRLHDVDAEKLSAMLSTLTQRGHVNGELRLRESPDRYRWVYMGMNLIETPPDDPAEVVALMMDISESKFSQSQLVQAAKMATLGEMTTGVAHELNQPLQVIQLAADNAHEALVEDGATPETVEYVKARLQRVTHQARRAADIIDHMRVFGRRSEEEDHAIALSDVVDGVLSLMGQQLTVSGVQVEVNHASPPAMVFSRLQPLEQVLLNCVSNARDALRAQVARNDQSGDMDYRARLRIRTFVRVEKGERQAVMEVADNGGGIPRHAMEHLFEPFFTTKPVGQGTGLGLSISYGIMRDLGGRIDCWNEAGGAVFSFVLPAVEVPANDVHMA
ncbi:PAS domain-containing sensor histidine kinase [Ectothiorhodospira variabilis]|uniref:PAS domain-containing sensor histidine kinase n=1 Tax=Ectothiorhodospira variabilis TaxID=505694 RepID=UPI001EFBA090|nr:ATP-binding protein [Ectothiorhodospira variabilis]MCG5495870.1 ATP-binding protein [Ectothiorhodospira variabilis]MCG5498527.1 ATP-binding protein [Ectothiorhodospira variabilis]MCG5505271.1 ATP-binding protein [Ectothiorhodospira variabilis]MCG5508428.1 ATP-binding protein [Ectothiorhodospira variabilis]